MWHTAAVAGHELPVWLAGEDSTRPDEPAVLSSRGFCDTGLYLLQAGRAGNADAVSVTVDAGPLGYGPLAAHGHADALSLTLRIGGADVLIDPGTYDYFSHPTWRAHFRRTRAHNTVELDGRDQSEMLGPFLWGRRANVVVHEWRPATEGGAIVAAHDGYAPLMHTRRVELDARTGRLDVEDVLTGDGVHTACVHWVFGEGCGVLRDESDVLHITLPDGRVMRMSIAIDGIVDEQRGGEAFGGWLSRRYHDRSPGVVRAGMLFVPRRDSDPHEV